jgi:hypothetical protein
LNAHEFLSLACNSKNRIELITNTIKTNMKLNKLEFSVNLIVNSKTNFLIKYLSIEDQNARTVNDQNL